MAELTAPRFWRAGARLLLPLVPVIMQDTHSSLRKRHMVDFVEVAMPWLCTASRLFRAALDATGC